MLAGLFQVVETLFSVHIKHDVAPTWHKDVRFYRVESHSGELLAQFYLDLYARPSKRSGAWMDDARTRRRIGHSVQTPIAFLNCNFSEPVNNRPALLSHDEVATLFHEFGHGLHHMLTRVEEMPVSGIHGVEWDAVELPSQFLENFCWEWDVLKHLTGHVESGLPLPRELFDKMLAAKNFQVGMQTLRQVEFGLFDMRVHSEFEANGSASVQQLLEEVRDAVAVIRPPLYNRFPNQFSHIFAGGYAAGYYSYKWAEVLSADAYGKFEEDGVLNPVTGALFRDEILGVGGSRPAIESFTSFRGPATQYRRLAATHGNDRDRGEEAMKSHVTLAMMALLLTSASFAQYRYVAPDGTVSYSDAPPAGNASHITVKDLPADAPLVAASSLPYALNQASSQFPVTLYTSAGCATCDSLRAYLKQRGVPFAEKTVGSNTDLAVVKRVSGDTALPVLMIGSQKSVGFTQSSVAGMLDDAGYPAASLLPRDYSYPAPVAASGAPANPAAAPNSAVGSSSPAPVSAPSAVVPPAQGDAPPGFKF